MPETFAKLTVEELAARLVSPDMENVQLIDVREPHEIEIAALPEFQNLPLSESEQWVDSITERFDPNAETIVLCHHGLRSAHMCQWLIGRGFTKVYNVEGGIDAYSIVVDRSVPRY